MTIRRITLADLAFGEPLRWDLFGPTADGTPSLPPVAKPLLQKGQVIAPSPQLDSLLEAGLYVEATAPVSVLHNLNDVNRRLERVLLELLTHTSAEDELRAIAAELVDAVERDPDIALACIFLNQIAGLYAVRHCVETAIVVAVIARAMHGTPDAVLTATAAALTMNASMVRQTEGFQGKDALSSEERAMVRRHPAESADLLRGAGVNDPNWLNYVMLHHENDDGSGYPKGKSGDEIPLDAKLISLSDRYCAHVSARNYRRSMLPDIALHNLFLDSEIPADVTVASHFIRQIGKYPPGALVQLENGEVGVVTRRQDDGTLAVNALRAADGKLLPVPTMRNTRETGCDIATALHEDDVDVRFSMRQIWGELAAL
jgi:HD-GYP domain-containing protein (c-di-GMP phosphodiesterase class II)